MQPIKPILKQIFDGGPPPTWIGLGACLAYDSVLYVNVFVGAFKQEKAALLLYSSNLPWSSAHLLEEAGVQFPAEAGKLEVIHRGYVGPEDI